MYALKTFARCIVLGKEFVKIKEAAMLHIDLHINSRNPSGYYMYHHV